MRVSSAAALIRDSRILPGEIWGSPYLFSCFAFHYLFHWFCKPTTLDPKRLLASDDALHMLHETSLPDVGAELDHGFGVWSSTARLLQFYEGSEGAMLVTIYRLLQYVNSMLVSILVRIRSSDHVVQTVDCKEQ